MIYRVFKMLTLRSGFIAALLAAVSGLVLSQAAVAQGSSLNPRFPRIATIQLGDGTELGKQSRIDVMKKADVVITGFWPGWGPYNGRTMENIVAELRASNPNIIVGNYTNVTETRDNKPVVGPKVNSETGPKGKRDWWLRKANGDRTSHWKSNFTVNSSSYVTPDSDGKRFPEWLADYLNKEMLGKADFNAMFSDVMTAQPIDTADWDGDGVDESKTSTKGINANAEGHVAFMNRWRQLQPGFMRCGNIGSWTHPNKTMPAVYDKLIECGLLEGAMGRAWSIEKWGGWHTMMEGYHQTVKVLKEPKIAMLNATVAKYDYRAVRYGLTSVLMNDGYFVPAPAVGDMWGAHIWYDEFDVDLGYPVDPPQTSAWSKGVYRRAFDNGVVLINPRGNGTQTVNVGSGLKRFRGTQDPSHNNGNAVNNLTLNDADGIILLWENPPEQAPVPKPPVLN